ncbi:hypothetical protein CCH79_00009511 [Gambusia affinis]|uniref:Uncharacterized protein n=1 Tax=Gambusia affinis TaxID=33528 RepID=A0A315VCL7_GAMAF|nr:hypothetical protein CCH79_00009511 [Gambusia affinis]
MYFVFVQLLSCGSAWFAIVIIVLTCLCPEVMRKVLYRHLCPTSTQKSQVITSSQMIRAGKQFALLNVIMFMFALHDCHLITDECTEKHTVSPLLSFCIDSSIWR